MISVGDISNLRSKSSLNRFIDDRYNGDPASFIADINATVNSLLQRDLNQVRYIINNLKPCFRHLPEYHRARLGAIEARYSHSTGRSKKALGQYKKAIVRLSKSRNFDAAARARQGLMDVYMYLGRYDRALEVGKKALAYFRRKDNQFNAARVMTNIGNVYHRLDRNRLALKYYEQARKIFVPARSAPLAILDFNRANIYANMNRLGEAEELYKASAHLFRENKMGLAVGKVEYSLAYLYFLADKYTEALSAFEKVMEIFENSGDARAIAVTQLDLAEINTHLNQFGSAVMLGEQAIASCKKLGLRYEQAKAVYFVAESHRRLGDYHQAAAYLKRAEKLFSKEDNKLWQGMVNLSRCRLKTATRRFDEALATARAARRLFRLSGDRRRGTDAEITLMEIHLESGKTGDAIMLGEKLLGGRMVGYQRHVVYSLLGMSYSRKEQSETALKYFKRSIGIIEKMLVNIYPDEIRFFFALDKYPTYLSAVNCLLQLDRVEESFLQHSRALAVLNQRWIDTTALRREVPQHLLEARAGLRASLKRMSRAPDASQRQVSGAGNVYGDEHKLWEIERKIRSYVYPSGQKHRLPLPAERSYTERLQGNEVVVSFVFSGKGIGAFCARKNHTRYIQCMVSRQELESTIRELHFLMEKAVYTPSGDGKSGHVINHYLRRIYDWLAEPLNLSETTRDVILVLDGLFAQIPFPALLDLDGNWLKDKFNIQVIVNPRDLQKRRHQAGIDGRSRCAVFSPTNAGLPLIESEGREVKRLYPRARFYAGEEAVIKNLRHELKRSGGFIHIATHASRSSENPLFSRIIMSDGPFFPFDLFGSGIHARLVSLSGCQTAAPGIFYGNSFSLAKAFYQGGADSVLASLWPISDKISMIFMAEFYKALRASNDILTAYNTAMDMTCSKNDNPAFWGAFVLLGR